MSVEHNLKLLIDESFEFHEHGVPFGVCGSGPVWKFKNRLLEFYFHSTVLSNQDRLA